ncbi:MAG: hypothetical protein AB1633_08375, partial [Elusimicrobiota bacterium]
LLYFIHPVRDVYQNPFSYFDESRFLFLDGALMSAVPSHVEIKDMIYFALLSHPNPSRILVIGCGDGDLITSALADPRIQRIDHVEIDPAVVTFARRYIPEQNTFQGRSIWENPRVRLHFADGRQFISESRDLYDIIIVDVLHISHEMSGPFYTVEFMKLINAHLNPGGLFLTHVLYDRPWVSSPDGLVSRSSLAAELIAVRTAQAVFGKHVYFLSPYLWTDSQERGDNVRVRLVLVAKEHLRITEPEVEKRYQLVSPSPKWLDPTRFFRWIRGAYRLPDLSELPVSTDNCPAILFASRWKDSPVVRKMALSRPVFEF